MSQSQDEKERGYWLIEPDAATVLTSNSLFHGFAAAFFGWLAGEVSTRLDLSSKSIRLEVIEANYHGAYPCLAASHPSGAIPESDAKQIESAIRDVIHKTTLEELLVAISSQQIPTGP